MKPLDDAMEAIEARVQTLDEKAQSRWEPKIVDLTARRDELRQMIKDVAQAGPYEWRELTPAIVDKRTDFERALSEAVGDLEVRRKNEVSVDQAEDK